MNQPAYIRVFEDIEAEILSGGLAEGSALPTEQELCDRFGVNRSTVREGVRLLEQAGLLRRVNAKRLVVARPEAEEAAERASRNLERHGVPFEDVIEAGSLMQPSIARLAAENATPEDIEALEAITAALKEAERSSEIIEHAMGYLSALGHATGNRAIEVMNSSLNLLSRSMLELVIDRLPNAQKRIVKAQTEITQALRARDVETATVWMARHADDMRRAYQVAGLLP